MKWKKIGLISGAGPLAAADIYSKLITECNLLGATLDEEYPEIILYNSPHLNVSEEGNVASTEQTKKALKKAVEVLEREKVEIYGIGCNSIHAFIPETKMKLVGIPEAVAQQVSKNWKKIALIATRETIETKIYQRAFQDKNVELIYPSEEQQKIIDQCISLVLQFNYMKARALIERLNFEMLQHADGSILGCSELPLAKPLTENTIDCNQALARALAKAALGA